MTKNSNDPLGIAELIRLELDGKNIALGRYDTVLWQVRSGYIVILYGALGMFFKDKLINPYDISDQIILLVCGFSFLACVMDVAFRIRQLRVVKAFNLLVDQVLKQSFEDVTNTDSLRGLLHLAGESNISLDRILVLRTMLFIFTFYAFTPVAMMYLFSQM